MIYLDNNATTRPSSRVVNAMSEMLSEVWFNPSSMHRAGQSARQRVELARKSVAELIGARPRDIVFTSGATEAINLAIRGSLEAMPPAPAGMKRAIITTEIEHEAVGETVRSLAEPNLGAPIEVRYLPVTREGIADASALESMLGPETALVSIMWANNETGAIQPVDKIGAICRAKNVLLHVDGTQWVGKMPMRVDAVSPVGGTQPGTPIDLLSFSAHKFHGPKGIGGLYIRRGVRVRPQTRGSQELERRGGTENTSGIVGMGLAAEDAMAWFADPANPKRLEALRDRLENGILSALKGISAVNGPTDPSLRLINTTNIGFARLEAEALLLLLSERGVCASAGSACASGSLSASHVLVAMGVPSESAHGSLRFSLSRDTTEAEIDEALRIIPECVARLRESMSSLV